MVLKRIINIMNLYLDKLILMQILKFSDTKIISMKIGETFHFIHKLIK